MKKFNVSGSVNSIETFGLVDGPGIRTVIFLNGCKLRCKYCHNPEMWNMGVNNYTPEELAKKILRNKNYYGNNGGVTFSGGEPLLQDKFIIEVCKILKREGIHVALDTAGVGSGNYDELLSYVDLVLFDVKHTDSFGYKDLTGHDISDSLKFIDQVNKSGVSVWIRQVIVPGFTDNDDYLKKLALFLKRINNIDRVDFLPFHKLGSDKYDKLGIEYPYSSLMEMDKDKCASLFDRFMNLYFNK